MILIKLNFLGIFSKNTQMSNFMKIPPMVAEMFHADRRAGGQTGRYDAAIFAVLRNASTNG
jgi:hypothetical protein